MIKDLLDTGQFVLECQEDQEFDGEDDNTGRQRGQKGG